MILMNIGTAMSSPFSIFFCKDSLKTVLILCGIYVFLVAVYLTNDRNYRRREEHGSARWGNAERLRRKYAAKDFSENIILTRNTLLGLDGRSHRRNLNVLVCGGSGSGKTRFYARPNLMQANGILYIYLSSPDICRIYELTASQE